MGAISATVQQCPRAIHTATLLLALLCTVRSAAFGQQRNTELLRYGRDASQTVDLPSAAVRDASDICFDPESHHLFVLLAPSKGTDAYAVRELDLSDHTVNRWELPKSLRPITGIWAARSEYRLVMAEGQGFMFDPARTAVVSLEPRTDRVKKQYTPHLWGTDEDDALDRQTATTVRAIMRRLSYYPAMPEQGGVPPPGSERYVFINNRPLDNDLVEWSPDKRSIFFGWPTLFQAAIAVKTSTGAYRICQVEQMLEAAIRAYARGNQLPSITGARLYDDLALIGIALRDLGDDAHDRRTVPVIVWLDLTRDPPSVVHVTPGRLVRTIHRY